MSKLSKKQKWAITIFMLALISVLYIKILSFFQDEKYLSKKDASLEYGNHYCDPGPTLVDLSTVNGRLEPYKKEKEIDWKHDKKFKRVKKQNKLLEPYILKIEKMGIKKEGMHYIRYDSSCSMTLNIDLVSQHSYEAIEKELDNILLIASYIDKSKVDVNKFTITYKDVPIDYTKLPIKISIEVDKLLHAKTKNERIHMIRKSNHNFFGELLYTDMKKIENKRFTIDTTTSVQDYSHDSFLAYYGIHALYTPQHYYEKSDYLKEDILFIIDSFKKNAKKYSFFTNPEEIIGEQKFLLKITRQDNEKGIGCPELVFTMEDFKNDTTLHTALNREFSK